MTKRTVFSKATRQPTRLRRRPLLEQLESRNLMAADFSGVVRAGSQWLFDADKDPAAESSQTFGLNGDPFYVSGRWNGGADRPGVVRKGSDGLLHWLLDTNGDANPDLNIAFGLAATDRPVVGDWDGNGTDNLGVVRPGADGLLHWFLDLDRDPTAEEEIRFGFPTDTPVVGNWDGQGGDNLGVARVGTDGLWHWFLDLDKDPTGEIERAFGLTNSDRPIPGDWNDDGRDTLGVTRPGSDGLLHWFLDANGDPIADEERAFGFPTDTPVKGNWAKPTTPPPPPPPPSDIGNTIATARTVNPLKRPETYNAAIETQSDVDMYRVNVAAGQRVWIDIDTPTNGTGGLGSYLRVFDASGRQLAANNDAQAPNETPTPVGETHINRYFDSYIGYTFTTGGTYYVGVSNWQNTSYDPKTGNSSPPLVRSHLTGPYSLTLTSAAAPSSGFDIQVVTTGLTSIQREIFTAAKTRWESIITGDLPDAIYNGLRVDDLRIDASFKPIDGAGDTLGQAYFDAVRSDSFLPIHGFMEFDTADAAELQNNGSLYNVILHEMGHVLGFDPNIWLAKGLLTGITGNDPKFVGRRATAEYQATFGTSRASVPVEADYGDGTRLSHWRESILDNELMTGIIEAPNVRMPISRITVGSFIDLGYTADLSAADTYSIPRLVDLTGAPLADHIKGIAVTPSFLQATASLTKQPNSTAGASALGKSIGSYSVSSQPARREDLRTTEPKEWHKQVDDLMSSWSSTEQLGRIV